MKGAEGPGRGRPRAAAGGAGRTGGDRQARRPGPGGSPRSRPSGVAPSPRGPLRAAAASLGVPRPFQSLFRRGPGPRESPRNTEPFFQAPLKPCAPPEGGGRFRTWTGAGWEKGPAAPSSADRRRLGPADPSRCSAAEASRSPEGYRRTGAPPAVRAQAGGAAG